MNHLDLYIEKIISPMNLDAEQRDEMVRELRCHLDESVESLRSRGLPEIEAERIAMENFGDPKAIAARFGAWQGNAWRWFEGIMLALVTASSVWIGLRFNSSLPFRDSVGYALLAGYAALILFQYLWNRVQINGVLKIYRFLRPTLHIPFSDITAVRLERFRLFGVRRFKVQYGSKTGSFHSGMPNAHCAALALKVLCPQAIDDSTTLVLDRQLETRPESLTKKIALSIAAITAAGLLLREIIKYPQGESASLGLPVALLTAIALAVVQYFTVVNRAKRGLFAFLGALLTLSIYLIYGAAAVSYAGFRYLDFFYLIMTLLIIGLVWWNGQKRMMGLLTTSAIIVGAVVLCNWLFLQPNPAWSISVRVQGLADSAQWIDQNSKRMAILSLEGGDNYQLNIVDVHADGSFNIQRQANLEHGTWTSVRHSKSKRKYYLRDYTKTDENDAEAELPCSDVYYMNDANELVKTRTIENTYGFGSSLSSGGFLVAPDGSTILMEHSANGRIGVGVHSLTGDDTKGVVKGSLRQFWRWSGDHTGEYVMSLDDDTSHTLSIVKTEGTDATSTMVKKLSFPGTYYMSFFKSSDVAIFKALPDEPFPQSQLWDEPDYLWVNPDAGTSYTIIGTAGDTFKYDWNPETNLLVYAPNAAYGQTLILTGKEGKIDQIPIGSGMEISWISLSPDSRKVLFMDRRTDKWTWNLGRLRLWDRDKKKVETVTLDNGIATILTDLRHDTPSSWRPVQWLPDGSGMLWGNLTPNYERRGMDTQFYRYKFAN